VLEEYLEDFNGCVIVVSHDRYFLDRTVDKIFALEPGGKIPEYPGNYSLYLEYKESEAAQATQAAVRQNSPEAISLQEANANATPTNPATKATTPKARKLSNKEKREYETLEAKIPQMEAEKQQLEGTLSHNPPKGYSQVQELSANLANLNIAIDQATERWLELSERH